MTPDTFAERLAQAVTGPHSNLRLPTDPQGALDALQAHLTDKRNDPQPPPLHGKAKMTKRERGLRDLSVLTDWKNGVSQNDLMAKHGLNRGYVQRLIRAWEAGVWL